MKLNINSDAAVKHTNTLEKFHRSALPNAIRGTLTKAAFHVKQDTMPKGAASTFVNRSPNFFKANSRVEMARGWNVDQMQSVVGFIEQGLKGDNNYSVRDLEQQERGGVIKGRSFVPTDVARGGSSIKPVRPVNRLSAVNKIVNANKGTGTQKQKFIKAAILAGAGGFVIGTGAKKILWRIDSIDRTRSRIRIRKKPIYSFVENRSVRVAGTGFMRQASLQSAKRMEEFYIEEAERQIKKLMN